MPADHSDADRAALRAQATQLADLLDQQRRQVADLERQLADARTAFRRERAADGERVAADRAEAARLKADAQRLHREAARDRDLARRLAGRFVRRVRSRQADFRLQLAADRADVTADRADLADDTTRLRRLVADFATVSALDRQRLKAAWDAVAAQQKRLAADRVEANKYVSQQEAAFAEQAADLDARERTLAAARETLAAEVERLRAESAALEGRATHAREAVRELERKRDAMHAELLNPPAGAVPAAPAIPLDRSADRDLFAWAAELDRYDRQLARDRAGLARVKADLERRAVALHDDRKVLAEQFARLAEARAAWQAAERRTVEEIEELAQDLRRREHAADVREQALARAERHRRESAYGLWQLQLRLEGWQSALTAHDARWRAERDAVLAGLDARRDRQARREAAVDALFRRLASARRAERERLTAEFQACADVRARAAAAAAAADRQRAGLMAQAKELAAKELAAEQTVAAALADGGAPRAGRRFEVLRKKWQRAFDRRLKEFDATAAALDAERAEVDDRYRELHRLIADTRERAAMVLQRQGLQDATETLKPEPPVAPAEAARAAAERDLWKANAELDALRDEVQRMAVVLMTTPSPDDDLPWATDADVLPFDPSAKAA